MYCRNMNKKRRVRAVAGEQNSSIGFRCSLELRTAFNKARKTGIEKEGAKILRPFIDDYIAFTDACGHQPSTLAELYQWVLSRSDKKK